MGSIFDDMFICFCIHNMGTDFVSITQRFENDFGVIFDTFVVHLWFALSSCETMIFDDPYDGFAGLRRSKNKTL